MRPGGQFGLVCLEKLLSKSILPEKVYFSDSEVYDSIATKCGFTVAFKSVEPHAYTFPSVDSYLDWYSASCNIDLDSVDPASIKAFKDEVGNGLYAFRFNKIQYVLQKPDRSS